MYLVLFRTLLNVDVLLCGDIAPKQSLTQPNLSLYLQRPEPLISGAASHKVLMAANLSRIKNSPQCEISDVLYVALLHIITGNWKRWSSETEKQIKLKGAIKKENIFCDKVDAQLPDGTLVLSSRGTTVSEGPSSQIPVFSLSPHAYPRHLR
eukprot:IDg2188t1